MQVQELVKPFVGDHCLICGCKPTIIGIFIPDEPETFGAPKGMTRFFRYCLCEKCQISEDVSIQVEKIIGAEIAGVKYAHA